MNYYIEEIQTSEGVQKTAGVKARDDADCIFKECGLEELLVENSSKGRGGNFVIRLISHATVNAAWKRTLEKLNSGDKVFVQFPCIEHSIFLSNTLKKLTERGVEIVLLIHDLELLRISKRKESPMSRLNVGRGVTAYPVSSSTQSRPALRFLGLRFSTARCFASHKLRAYK